MRCRLALVSAVVALLLQANGTQAQNLLTNGGLELTPPDPGGRFSVAPGWVTDDSPKVPWLGSTPTPGDYNNAGVPEIPCPGLGCNAVDAADWVVFRKFLGTNFQLANEIITPGMVTPADGVHWQIHYGEPPVVSFSQPSDFTHILETFSPNPPAPDSDGTWQHWFEPYNGTESGQEDNFAHLYQDVPGTPGLQYTMTGWAMGEQVFPGGVNNLNAEGTGAPFNDGPASPTNVYFALEFLDNGGAVLPGSLEKELKDDLGFVNSGDPDVAGYLWQQFTLAAVAPAGTVSVRVRASMTDGVFNPIPEGSPELFRMSFFVDEFSLTAASPGSGSGAVPEPGIWLMVAITVGVWSATRRDFLSRR
jgi:hypothetical protein